MTFTIENRTYTYKQFETDYFSVTSQAFSMLQILSNKFICVLNKKDFKEKYSKEQQYFIKYLLETINYFGACICLIEKNVISQVLTLLRTTFEYYTISAVLLENQHLILPFYHSRYEIRLFLSKSKEKRKAYLKDIEYKKKQPYQIFLENEWLKEILPNIENPTLKDLQKHLNLETVIALNEFLNANVHGTINLFEIMNPYQLNVQLTFDIVYLTCGLFGKFILQLRKIKEELFDSIDSIFDVFATNFSEFRKKYCSISYLQFDFTKDYSSCNIV